MVFQLGDTLNVLEGGGRVSISAKNEGNRASFVRAVCDDGIAFPFLPFFYILLIENLGRVEIAPFGVVVGPDRTQNFNITFTPAADNLPLGT